jgi:DNA-binding transcriptional MocR family regulator
MTLSLDARRGTLALSRELDIPVIEDSAYSALRLDGSDKPSIQALDVEQAESLDASRVIYLGTFSKTVAPGLRIGWICASRAMIRRLVLIKQASDLNVPVINQMVIHQLASNHIDAMIAAARLHYRIKRDAMLRALSAHMPRSVNPRVASSPGSRCRKA